MLAQRASPHTVAEQPYNMLLYLPPNKPHHASQTASPVWLIAFLCICVRRDVEERPELYAGSVEYVATAAYCVRPPMRPAHLFVVDVSQAAVASGATATACSAIAHTLGSVPCEWWFDVCA